MENLLKVEAPSCGEIQPKIMNTRRGRVEYASFGVGPAVLALHGAMGGYDQGLILARTIGATGYQYVAVSRPGYLDTPLKAGNSPEEQADLCADLLDELGVRDVAVIAVSGGGPCAIHFALRHRDRCRGLVLVSTCSGKIDTPLPLAFHVMKVLARWPAFVNYMRQKTTKDPERAARRSIADSSVRARMLRDPEAGPLFAELTNSTFDRMSLRLPGTKNDIEVTRRRTVYPLEKIAVPTLVVHGTADRVVPFTPHAKMFEARVPGVELLAIEGGEHVTIFTHRNEVAAHVAEFLAAHAR